MAKPAPEAVRLEAIELVRSGESVSEAARRVGVTAGAVSKWGQSAGIDLSTKQPPGLAAYTQQRNAETAQKATETAEKMRHAAERASGDGDGRNAQHFAIAYGIFTDKHLLLTGQATSRHEQGETVEQQRLRVLELATALELRRSNSS